MSLTNDEFALLQRSIEAIMEKIADLGLNLVVETDFRGLMDFMRERQAFINPTFNPVFNDISRDGFWFRLTDLDGNTVASHADRIFRVDDFCDVMETGELWYGLQPERLAGRKVEVIRPSIKIGGTVTHSGALWIDPAWRNRGLSLYLPYLSRSICMRNHGTRFHTGVVLKSLNGSRVPRENYGYPHVELCIRGYFPATDKVEEVFMCYMSDRESLELVRQLPDHQRFPVSFDIGDEGLSDGQVVELPVVAAREQHVHFSAVVGHG